MCDAIMTALPADVPVVVSAAKPPLALPVDVLPPRRRGFVGILRGSWRIIGSIADWLFGAAAILFGLALLAAIPILQFMSLGYLLESGGRIARTGRLRDGFIGIRRAARLGSIALGVWLALWPLRFVASVARAAFIIDPAGPAARSWQIGLTILAALTALHIVGAISRGGQLRYFFWPFNLLWLLQRMWRGGYYTQARDAVWDFVVALRLPYYFWLGCRGFAGTMAWLILPVSLIAFGRVAPLLGFLGAFLLAVVVLHLPFLQMRFAVDNRLGSMFAWRSIRAGFRRAPWAYTFACFITLAFALPLYLLKIEMVPREVAWLPSLVFIAFIFPARLLTGWAYGRSLRRATPRHWFFRWTGRLWLIPTAGFYILFVFLSQYTSWEGIWSLYEQHAFLVPVPFMGM
jgi:hypothetical protein